MSGPSGAAQPVAATLAAFAADCRRCVPAHVEADAIERVLDVLGNSLAASESTVSTEPHNALRDLVVRRGGLGEASLFTGGVKLPASAAALVNGTLAHSLDFDDTHLPSVLHPSASVVSAALAVAEAQHATGRAVLAAIAAGDEICNRLGAASFDLSLRNSIFFEKGMHATSICGTIAAAVAAGMLLELDERRLVDAMAIAASMGAGLLEANRTGGTVKRMHCGWAAHAGVDAAYFAAAGVTGPPTVFEGRFGFLQAYLGDAYDLDAIVGGLGDRWELLRTVYKPYPSNHFTHPGIDCALELRAQGVDAEEIESIELGVAAAPLRTIGEPTDEKINVQSGYHAKFSGPYTLAAALLGGGGLGVYLDDFTDDAIRDPRRQSLARKVTVVSDEICDREFPHAFSAVLRVRTRDGRRWEHRTHSSRGGPEHPLSAAEIETKFRMNARRVWPEAKVAALAAAVRSLPETTDTAMPT